VGPVAVTSLLLGTGLKDVVDAPIQADPNAPTDPEAQTEYNQAAIQVRSADVTRFDMDGFYLGQTSVLVVGPGRIVVCHVCISAAFPYLLVSICSSLGACHCNACRCKQCAVRRPVGTSV
jgi:hypothetical protein